MGGKLRNLVLHSSKPKIRRVLTRKEVNVDPNLTATSLDSSVAQKVIPGGRVIDRSFTRVHMSTSA